MGEVTRQFLVGVVEGVGRNRVGWLTKDTQGGAGGKPTFRVFVEAGLVVTGLVEAVPRALRGGTARSGKQVAS